MNEKKNQPRASEIEAEQVRGRVCPWIHWGNEKKVDSVLTTLGKLKTGKPQGRQM